MARNEASAVGSILRLGQCLDSAQNPEQGLPPSLESMGPAGSNCIDAHLASGARLGYTFRYTPGAAEASKPVTRFTVSARPLRYGRTGKRSFFSDESGIIRATEEQRPATADDPPVE
jgi:hypothetical protein